MLITIISSRATAPPTNGEGRRPRLTAIESSVAKER